MFTSDMTTIEVADVATTNNASASDVSDGVSNMTAWLDSLPPDWQSLLDDMKRRRQSRFDSSH